MSSLKSMFAHENNELTNKCELANDEIANLKVEITRLEVEILTLKAKLADAYNEIARVAKSCNN